MKIGTQYWMGSNLKTSLYIDGEEIPKLEIMNAGATGYLLSQTDKSYYFYSFGTIVSNKLLPVGWNMPDWNDWNMLKTYLSNDASLFENRDMESNKYRCRCNSRNCYQSHGV